MRTKVLLEETLEAIEDSGHSSSDVIFIGSLQTGHRCTWPEFEKLADVAYNYGYGAQLVATDLAIVFSDGQSMTRGEYAGSEFWDYRRPYFEPKQTKEIFSLFVSADRVGWKTLEQINDPDPEAESN
ncbi:MAG: hypothetical protein Q8Q57_12485 [Methylotenera sp.]|nr:hypothetical protein [Methylotenera sp.]